MSADLAIVIVNWRVYELLAECLAALPAAVGALSSEVVVIDNEASAEPLAALERRFPGVKTIANAGNRGFAAACNQGILATRSRHVVLLNPDTVPAPESLAILAAWLDAHPGAAAAGPAIVDGEGRLQKTSRRFPRLRYLLLDTLRLGRRERLAPWLGRYHYGEWDHREARAVDQVIGACFVMPRQAIHRIGLLDERFFLYYEEVDWCIRARHLGLEIHYVPQARVMHRGGASSGQDRAARVAHTYRSLRELYRKHHGPAGRLGLELVLALDRLGRALLRRAGKGPGEAACAASRAS